MGRRIVQELLLGEGLVVDHWWIRIEMAVKLCAPVCVWTGGEAGLSPVCDFCPRKFVDLGATRKAELADTGFAPDATA